MSALSYFRVLLLTLAAAACAAEPSVQVAVSRTTEAQVYAAVLDTLYASAGSNERAVQDSTVAPIVLPFPGEDISLASAVRSHERQLPGVRLDTQSDFLRRATDAVTLPAQLPTRLRVAWVPPEVARAAGERIATFYDEIPTSVTQLSPIGFSRDSTQALLYLSERCPGLCGHGEYVLLERTDDGWRVVARSQAWLS